MAYVKISQLPAAAALTGAELVPVVQGGVTSRVSVNNLKGPDGVRYFQTYATMTALTAANGLTDNMVVEVASRATENDGGGGTWRYDAGSSATANGGTVLASDTGVGRWLRIYYLDVDARWFGVVANGSTDDAAAMATFLTAVEALNSPGVLPTGTILINSGSGLSSNTIGLYLRGAGATQTIIKAGGSFAGAYLLRLEASSAETYFEHIDFDTTGRSARCVTIVRGQTATFNECSFKGNQTLSLVHSTGDFVIMNECRWDVDGANTVAMEWDEYNQNCTVRGGRVGSIGKGFLISRTGANPRVEGWLCSGVKFINTGEYNIRIGNSFLTQIEGCICDQATDYCVYIHNGADQVSIADNWLGLSAASVGTCVFINSDAGSAISIDNNNISGGNSGIAVLATASLRVAGVTITNNDFSAQSNQGLALDSVNDCIITGNRDGGTPTFGSWYTVATHASGGRYTFDNNRWHTATPALFHTGSVYRGGEDTGIVWRNRGRVAVSPAATSQVIAHGLFRAPTLTSSYVNANLEGHQGDPYLTAVGATNITVNWTTSTTPIIYWEAMVA